MAAGRPGGVLIRYKQGPVLRPAPVCIVQHGNAVCDGAFLQMQKARWHFANKQPAARAQNNGQHADDGLIHKARAKQGAATCPPPNSQMPPWARRFCSATFSASPPQKNSTFGGASAGRGR